jgi:hypothetical protein
MPEVYEQNPVDTPELSGHESRLTPQAVRVSTSASNPPGRSAFVAGVRRQWRHRTIRTGTECFCAVRELLASQRPCPIVERGSTTSTLSAKGESGAGPSPCPGYAFDLDLCNPDYATIGQGTRGCLLDRFSCGFDPTFQLAGLIRFRVPIGRLLRVGQDLTLLPTLSACSFCGGAAAAVTVHSSKQPRAANMSVLVRIGSS